MRAKIDVVKESSNGNFICHCPFHSDFHPSFSISENGLWLCFSCGRRGNIETLSYLLKVDFPEETLVSQAELARKILPKEEPNLEIKMRLYQETYNHNYLEKRGVTLETAKKFSIGYDRLEESVVFPTIVAGKVVALSSRNIHTKAHRVMGRKSLGLFGQQFLDYEKPIIIVEGQIDAMKAYQLGYENTVAVVGSLISEAQMNTITKFPGVYLGFDNDKTGREANMYYGGIFMRVMPTFVVKYNKKDFGDSNQIETESYVRYRYV